MQHFIFSTSFFITQPQQQSKIKDSVKSIRGSSGTIVPTTTMNLSKVKKHKKPNRSKFDKSVQNFFQNESIIDLDRCDLEDTIHTIVDDTVIHIKDDELFTSTPNRSHVTIREGEYHTVDLTGPATIDLEEETTINSINESQDTVIHHSVNESQDTVIHRQSGTNINLLAAGLNKMSSRQKTHLLEMITNNILGGCAQPVDLERCQDTPDVTFIKEVVLGEAPSRCSTGSNVFHPGRENRPRTGLRMIVIDGSNVAVGHSNGREFSVKGLKICIDYFLRRGHVVKAFVPRFRCKRGKSSDPRLLDSMERAGHVVYTPSREIQGRLVTSYDDRYIVQTAAEFDGIIVSGDNFRDIADENPKWRRTIENNLLMFTWIEDLLIFPKDPLGRNGPPLERFLRHP